MLMPVFDHLQKRLRFSGHRQQARILANSMPKAGTNLLIRLLDLIPGLRQGPHIDLGPNEAIESFGSEQRATVERFCTRITPGMYASSHCFYFPELADLLNRQGIRCVTIVRDPRDVCVSDYHYIVRSEAHRLHEPYLRMLSDDQRLMASIVGMTSDQLCGDLPSLDIGRHYEHYVGWQADSDSIVVRFEDLIGSRGGGDDRVQRETIERVVDYLGVGMSRRRIDQLCENLFSCGARTFRRGQIGDWQREFRDEHRQAFQRVAGHVLESFGYVS